MENPIDISDIKVLYPDEWVLLGNPILDESKLDVILKDFQKKTIKLL
jgi:hypothetical protein